MRAQGPFFIRLKDNRLVPWGAQPQKIREFLTHLGEGEERVLYKEIDHHDLMMVCKKLKDETLVVCSNLKNPATVLSTYKTRWGIERCSKDMKSQGLNLEKTHMRCPERLKKLMAVVAVAMLWCGLVGSAIPEIYKKSVKTPLYSCFTRGLRWIKDNMNEREFERLLKRAVKSEG